MVLLSLCIFCSYLLFSVEALLTPEFVLGDLCTMICMNYAATALAPAIPNLLQAYRNMLAPCILKICSEKQWGASLSEKFAPLSKCEPGQAKKLFMIMIQKLPLYGSRFFKLTVSDSRIKGLAILCVNHAGIQFHAVDTRDAVLSYGFNEIVSTRRLGSRATGKHYVDLKLGNLMVQRVTRYG